MSSQIVTSLFLMTIVLSMFHASYSVTVSPLCEPGVVEGMPPHIKRVCMAIENSDQFTTALKRYINNEAENLISKPEELASNFGKRTDVDHVFLRFGKRR